VTIEATEPGLRERKRLATRRAIQLAVLDLVTSRGIDNVTVDEISRVADISPRTFFNYFASKEAALIGDGPSLPADERLQSFIGAGPDADILTGIGELLAGASEETGQDIDLNSRRRELLKTHPELFAIRMANMRQFEDELADLVELRMRADEPASTRSDRDIRQKARLVTLMAFAAMKHAWACWADAGGADSLSSRLRQSFAEMRTVNGTLHSK